VTTSDGTPVDAPSLIDAVERGRIERAEEIAVSYRSTERGERVDRTFSELARRVSAIAAGLAGHGLSPGDRALLVFPPGLDFVEAFLGCLRAGVVAVPVHPPDFGHPERTLLRIRAIADDCGCRFSLTLQSLLAARAENPRTFAAVAKSEWVASDVLAGGAPDDSLPVPVDAALAFIQYTSGSTREPKGVVLTHGNLRHNTALAAERFAVDASVRAVSWLPPYHDMGLIGMILTAISRHARLTLLSPLEFIRSPLSWLRVMTEEKGTISGGPNFAYELCARRARPDDLETLDLIHWRVAFNGSEPVRLDTLKRFARVFAGCGFREEALTPCYGLAEATLMVTSRTSISLHRVGAEALRSQGEARGSPAAAGEREDSPWRTVDLVSSGSTSLGTRIAIVDPETLLPLPDDRVGEILVQGPSVAQGYWADPKSTEATFRVRLPGRSGFWLRTGDLGFLSGGELFPTARRKDIIVCRGRNLAPQDVEAAFEASHRSFRPGSIAAFPMERDGTEWPVVVQEVRDDLSADAQRILQRAREAVAEACQVELGAALLVSKGSVPKTTSGKVQRGRCRARYLAGDLPVLARWVNPRFRSEAGGRAAAFEAIAGKAAAGRLRSRGTGRLQDELRRLPRPEARLERVRTRLRQLVAETLGCTPDQVACAWPLADAGIESLQAVALMQVVGDELDEPLPETLLFAYPTIDELAGRLSESRSVLPGATAELDALIGELERCADRPGRADPKTSDGRA